MVSRLSKSTAAGSGNVGIFTVVGVLLVLALLVYLYFTFASNKSQNTHHTEESACALQRNPNDYKDCGDVLYQSDCSNCQECGWCTDVDKSGKCVPGDASGPKNANIANNCDSYWYLMTCH